MSITKFRNFLEGNKFIVYYFLIFVTISGCTKAPVSAIENNTNLSTTAKSSTVDRNTILKARFCSIYNSFVLDINNGVLHKDIEITQENVDKYLKSKDLQSFSISYFKQLYGEIMPYMIAVNNGTDPLVYFKAFMSRNNISTTMSDYLIKSLENENYTLNLDEISSLNVSANEKEMLVQMNMLASSYVNGDLNKVNFEKASGKLEPRGGIAFGIIFLAVVGGFIAIIVINNIVQAIFGTDKLLDTEFLAPFLAIGFLGVLAIVSIFQSIFSKEGDKGK